MICLDQYKDIEFPEGFLWGATTAGQQVEGNNNSYHDIEEYAPKSALGGIPYEMPLQACDSYNRYEDDIALLKSMNLSIYRMSIEWSRIEPEEGVFDEKEIEHYFTILKRLKEEGIQTVVTLHHVSHPVWFHKKGWFDTMDNMDVWERYIRKVIPIYKDYVDYWIVLNELNIVFEYNEQQRINMLQYHAKGYHTIKEYCDTPVSSTISYSMKEPLRGRFDTPDRVMADYIDYCENEFFLHAIRTGEIVMPFHDAVYMPELKGTCDFWALNTYVRQMINSRKAMFRFDTYDATHFSNLDVPFFTEEICPDIMIEMLMRFRDKPVLITENGFACKDDQIRITYIAAMLQAMHQAIDLGANLIGYMHWSLLDNWEWGTYATPFGLAEVDRTTFARTLKPSGHFYGEIAGSNAMKQEMIQRYCKN